MALTRLKVCPVRSSAAMVLSKVGAAGLRVMWSISVRFSAMAASSPGLKSATRTWSKGGSPPAGPTHGASSGFNFVSKVGILPRSCCGRKRGAPDLVQPPANLRVGRGLDNAFVIPFEGQVMQHRSEADVRLFQPPCRCGIDHARSEEHT